MPRRRLIWQIFPLFVLVSVVSLLAAAFYATYALRSSYHARSAIDLESLGRVVEPRLSPLLAPVNEPAVHGFCSEISQLSGVRITVILPDGSVVADSGHDPDTMDNHADRPEIVRALHGEVGRSLRFSLTMNQNMNYVAIPVMRDAAILGVLRMSVPQEKFLAAIGGIGWQIALGGVLVAVFVGLLSLAMARRITQPLDRLREGAENFARGDLLTRLRMPESEEMGRLAESMNTMAAELQDRIRTVERQRNELEAVLSSMAEGVLAVNNDEQIIILNSAAAAIFGVERDRALGRDIHEYIRNSELQRFVAGILAGTGQKEGTITLSFESEQSLRVTGTPLASAQGKNIGALVVLHDITHLLRLENARRDFVANVSHELKTPITSIKGYVETLLEGAIDDMDSAKRFLGIIGKQADRLNALIEDLLNLSRLEQEDEKESIALEKHDLGELVDAAIQGCEQSAVAKQIRVSVNKNGDASALVNPPLLQLAIENLLDNAIKYSDNATEVAIEIQSGRDQIVIRVRDQGWGIEREHLPRIFERFYRVDKARSRKLGGTGLGLAIVKHIVRVHGGQTHVESTPRKGSVFTISLPALPPAPNLGQTS